MASLTQLSHLLLFFQAGGFLLSLGALDAKLISKRYYLYHGLGAVGLGALAYWIVPDSRLLLGLALGIVYCLLIGKPWAKWLFIPMALALLWPLWAWPPTPQFSSLHFAINSLGSLLALGFTMGAMLLGHWYLIEPKLSFTELKRTTFIWILIMVARLIWSTYILYIYTSPMPDVELYLMQVPGLFILMRWLWGLFAPVVLSYFIWQTVKLSSNQSATGLLYVAVLFVLTGEILSLYIMCFQGGALMKTKLAMKTKMETLCPHCHERVEMNPLTQNNCPDCEAPVIQHSTDAFLKAGKLEQCPICGARHLYRQKDFNRKLGLTMIAIGAFLSYWTYGLSLVIVALIDWLIYKRVGEVGVCYQCQSVFRGLETLKDIPPFKLELHDYYRSLQPA